MNKLKRIILLLVCIIKVSAYLYANEPQIAWLFAYTGGDYRHNGIEFAWSVDNENWNTISHRYIKSDYGTEKRMIHPILKRDKDGLFHCLFSASETDGTHAHATSKDLVKWGRQNYTSSPDKTYAEAVNKLVTIELNGVAFAGTKMEVEWSLIDGLIKAQQLATLKALQNEESSRDDQTRFANLQTVEAKISIDATRKKTISNMLMGVFFEDLNYASDGGIYAELVQNRDFEYTPQDKQGKDSEWNSSYAWKLKGDKADWTIETADPIHPNNKHYARLKVTKQGLSLANEGFAGIVIRKGEKYDFSLFARMSEGKSGKLTARLVGVNGQNYGEAVINSISNGWKRHQTVITAKETDTNARIELIPQQTGTMDLDMISLFPQMTFKGRKNGLRADLAQTVADIKPKFVRFPGGCLAHGDGLDNMYRWKNTIGALETRVPQPNIWRYHQTVGLGYFEYFQFCEDIGAEPMPIVAAGVPCQNSVGGQQGGIPMCHMDDYIQEIIDLIEWANGDPKKNKWAKMRADAGHPKPFNLKYIGVGNEDQITDVFEERFTVIYKVLKEKYPEIVVIGTTGPFSEGTDYEEGWELATKLGLPMVDEHYYQQSGWFINNQHYYDRYDRNKSKVYLGEYAARSPGGPNLESALAEALYLSNIERNGDVVSMTSYAPLLAKEGFTQWNPDLIYFTNTEVKPTVGYYVQKLYGENAGDEYLSTSVRMDRQTDAVVKRLAVSTVIDTKSGDLIIKLVNMLPVAIKPTLTIKGHDLENTAITKVLLSGEPSSKTARPVVIQCDVNEMLGSELPPYSFTVYRVKQ